MLPDWVSTPLQVSVALPTQVAVKSTLVDVMAGIDCGVAVSEHVGAPDAAPLSVNAVSDAPD